MNSIWDTIFAIPFHYIEMVFAFLATLSFLVFFRGFLGSIGNLFKMNAHEGHLEHAQVRTIWGVYLLIFLFFVWEMTRTVASWLGFQDGGQVTLGYWCAGIIIVVWLFLFLKKNLFSGGDGGH